MGKILCIYHGNCADGFGAAWAVRRALGENRVEFHAGTYQDAPPDVADRHVLLVDFSYKRPALLDMAAKARSIIILDHHKSAAEDLAGFGEPAPFEEWSDDTLDRVQDAEPPIAALFDMKRSGAGIAWDFLSSGAKRPHLIDIIEDRDLGGGISHPPKFPYTRAVQTVLFSYPYHFPVWDWLMARADNPLALQEMIAEGEAIDRKHHKDIDELLGVVRRFMKIGGHVVPVANLPYTLTSDAGHKMAKGHPFAACYWDTPAGRVFSLRSQDDGADVSEVAKIYGGGGHKHAAGFRVAYEDLAQFEVA